MMSQAQRQEGIRARNAVWASFFFRGLVGMAWIPRIPEIKSAFNLTNGQFGLVLLATTAGAVPGLITSGRIIKLYSSRFVIRSAGLLLPFSLVIMGFAGDVKTIVAGLFLGGFSRACLDVALNSQGVEIEKVTSRRWMSSFHGMWSIGAFSAIVFGGVTSNLISLKVNFLLIAVIALVAFLVATPFLLPPELDGHRGRDSEEKVSIPSLLKREAPVFTVIGIGVICSSIAEGSAYDWSGILLKEDMGFQGGLNSAAATTFLIAMIISRLSGDRFFESWGYRKTVALFASVSSLIWGLSLLASISMSQSHKNLSILIACAGFAAAGIGLGPIYPAFIVAAASIKGVAPSVGLAQIALLAVTANFIGPLFMGGIAQATSLPVAFTCASLLLLSIALQVRFIRVKIFQN